MASFGTKDNNSIIKDSMVASTDSLTQKQDSARKSNTQTDIATTLHWFAQIGHDLNENDERDNGEVRNHEEKLRQVKDRQNEERQRKLEELKAQAMAAQKYREQKEEERKRRIEEMKLRENDKRQQVEDRKKAIMDAERERREYIVRKNQERDARLDTKRRNERSSISFAFGSSTPRLLDPVEVSLVSPNGSYWGHRRSTSITNVSYGNGNATQLSRRSSERELSDGAKKRATSAGGLDRPDDESIESSPFVIRSVARRKTDLMPTIPIRDSNFGSRTSLYCSTPRTQDFKSRGRAVSMTRLDQLAQPTRRKGEHIRAVIERERKQHIEESLAAEKAATTRKMSRSLTHLSSGSSIRSSAPLKYSLYQSGRNSSTLYSTKSSIQSRPLRKSNATKSMTQLVTAKLLSTSKSPTVIEARKAQTKHANDIEIDSRTTNVSVAGSRSGEVTPGGSSRPGSAMSTSTTASGVVYRRSTTTRKPRPASIASTGMSMSVDSPEVLKALNKKDKPPSRPSSAIRRSSSNTAGNLVNGSSASNSPRTPSAVTNDTTKRPERRASAKKVSTASRAVETPKLASPQTETVATDIVPVTPSESVAKKIKTVQKTEKVEHVQNSNNDDLISTETTTTTTTTTIGTTNTTEQQNVEQVQPEKVVESVTIVETKEMKAEPEMSNGDGHSIESNKTIEFENNDMTASMIQRRIRSEDEAKAALAERRRKAREEAERLALLEKQREEEERQMQLKLQAAEEERQRLFELEALRLVEEQRRAEEERLQKAIEEAQKREEEERARKEAEEKARIEREEQEQKAREEAEKQKIEVAERLKREEKEREERRKRVEAIMSRTRAKTAAAAAAANNTPIKSEDVSSQQTSNNESMNNTSANNTASIESTDSNRKSSVNDYEKSVTDKENALIHTFSNLIENKQSPQHTVHHAENNGLHNDTKTNGKLLDFTHSLSDDHTNDIAKTPISNGNGHPLISNLDNKIDSDLISNQLLDLSLDSSQTAEHTVNFNNNSLISSAPLVTSDSHETKEISLL